MHLQELVGVSKPEQAHFLVLQGMIGGNSRQRQHE